MIKDNRFLVRVMTEEFITQHSIGPVDELKTLANEIYGYAFEAGYTVAGTEQYVHCQKHMDEPDEQVSKFSLFTHIQKQAVCQMQGVPNVSEVPDYLDAMFNEMGYVSISVRPEDAMFQHVKRQTVYLVAAVTSCQAESGDFPVVVYEDIQDGEIYTRVKDEFFDGRFTPITPAAVDMFERYSASVH